MKRCQFILFLEKPITKGSQRTEPPVLGNNPDKDPGAGFTKLGRTMYGQHARSECQVEKQFFLQSTTDEFMKLCNLEILGVTDAKPDNAQIHEDFLEQLTRNQDGHTMRQDCLGRKVKFHSLLTETCQKLD